MALRFLSGDIFAFTSMDLERGLSDVGLAHGVNTRGLMGAGVAATFARTFPAMVDRYRELCDSTISENIVGTVFDWSPRVFSGIHVVYNMFTQLNPGADARIGALETCLETVLRDATSRGLRVVRMPLVGAGIGGLAVEDVIHSIYSIWNWERPSCDLDVVVDFVLGKVPA